MFYQPLNTTRTSLDKKHHLLQHFGNNSGQMVFDLGSRDGTVIVHLPPMQASLQCGLGLIPRLDIRCGLSLLLVLVLAPRGFSLGTLVFPSPQKPTFPNSNFQGHTLIGVSLCCVFLAIVRCKLNKVFFKNWLTVLTFRSVGENLICVLHE